MKKDLNNQKTLIAHKRSIKNKKILKRIYLSFYKEFANIEVPKGLRVEIGSGAGFIKKIIPQTITSDVIAGPGIKRVFSVEKIPFKNKSVSVFYLLNVFHHIKNPEKSLKEMERCLKPKGKIIMIEPYNSIWGRFIYQNFHHEKFNPKAGWKIKGKGRLSDANGAMPWIIFVRDRKVFEKKFPDLIILKIRPHTPLSYLLSGGLSKPQLIPSKLYPPLKLVEKLLAGSYQEL